MVLCHSIETHSNYNFNYYMKNILIKKPNLIAIVGPLPCCVVFFPRFDTISVPRLSTVIRKRSQKVLGGRGTDEKLGVPRGKKGGV